MAIPAHGIELGDLVAESRVGAPLQAYVQLSVEPGEMLDQICLALGKSGASANTPSYLSHARLSVETVGGRPRVRISTSEPIRERTFTLLLEAGCTSKERIAKEYAVLLEPEAPRDSTLGYRDATAESNSATPQPGTGTRWTIRPGETLSSIAQAIYPHGRHMRAKLVHAIVRANPAVFPDASPDHVAAGTLIIIPDLRTIGAEPVSAPKLKVAAASAPAEEESPALKAKPATKKTKAPKPETAAQTARIRSGNPAEFRLKLATEGVDLSLIGKLGDTERKLLREQRQAMLDADDQTASLLAMKYKVSRLEAQLADMRARFNRPGAPPAFAQPPVSAATAWDAPELVKYGLTLYLLPAAQILMAFLALFFLVRYYHNIKASLRRSGALLMLKQRPLARRPVLVEPAKDAPLGTEFDRTLVVAATAEKAAAPEAAIPGRGYNVDEILEEAQLYVIHGHPKRAIDLLEEQIRTGRGEVRVWMLLFVIFRSQGMRSEFEKLAHRLRNVIRDPELWENVRTLGHEFDPRNELYLSEEERQRAREVRIPPRETSPGEPGHANLVFEIPEEEEKSGAKPA